MEEQNNLINDFNDELFVPTKIRIPLVQEELYQPLIEHPLFFLSNTFKSKKVDSRREEQERSKNQCDYLYYISKYEECLQLCELELNKNKEKNKSPFISDLLETAVRCCMRLKDYDKAITHIKPLLGSNFRMWRLLADIQLQRGFYQNSLEAFQKSVILHNKDYHSWYSLALKYYNFQNNDWSFHCIVQCINLLRLCSSTNQRMDLYIGQNGDQKSQFAYYSNYYRELYRKAENHLEIVSQLVKTKDIDNILPLSENEIKIKSILKSVPSEEEALEEEDPTTL